MGIIQRDPVEKDFDVIEDQMSLSSNDDSEKLLDNVRTPVKNAPRHLRKKNPGSPMNYAKPSGRKAQGSRASRRFENLHFLISLTDNEEFGELDITDFVEPNVSAFATLFMEKEKMKIWNDFINQSEEEQDKLLKKRRSHDQVNNNSKVEHVVESDNTWDILSDLRQSHPAFSAKECFNRIDNNLKSVLRRRQFPKGTLASLEEELTSFFVEYPSSVFIYRLKSSYERLLLHALCQYMDLQSHSYENEGYRQTQVENQSENFILPDLPLTEFVESGCKNIVMATS